MNLRQLLLSRDSIPLWLGVHLRSRHALLQYSSRARTWVNELQMSVRVSNGCPRKSDAQVLETTAAGSAPQSSKTGTSSQKMESVEARS